MDNWESINLYFTDGKWFSSEKVLVRKAEPKRQTVLLCPYSGTGRRCSHFWCLSQLRVRSWSVLSYAHAGRAQHAYGAFFPLSYWRRGRATKVAKGQGPKTPFSWSSYYWSLFSCFIADAWHCSDSHSFHIKCDHVLSFSGRQIVHYYNSMLTS